MPKTIKALLAKPGIFVRDYLSGKRKPYTTPLQFFFLALTVFLIVFNAVIDDYFTYTNKLLEADNTGKINPLELQSYIKRNLNLFIFFQPVIFAAFLRLFFLNNETTYAENLLFSVYMIGTGMLISSVVLLALLIDPRLIALNFFATLLFYTFAIAQFSRSKGIGTYFKSFAVFAASTFTYIMFVTVITLTYYIVF